MSRPHFDLSVYFVADPSLCRERDLVDVVMMAVEGGVTMVQLRNKSGDDHETYMQASMLSEMLKNLGVTFIVNDNVDVAFASAADGVHLGQSDASPAAAREKLGPGKIIGLTAFQPEHFSTIDLACADYAGAGPFYETKTDKGKPVLGPKGFRDLVRMSPVPVVGIGGIAPGNAGAVIEAGASGVAMMRGISEAAEPQEAARQYVEAVCRARKKREVA